MHDYIRPKASRLMRMDDWKPSSKPSTMQLHGHRRPRSMQKTHTLTASRRRFESSSKRQAGRDEELSEQARMQKKKDIYKQIQHLTRKRDYEKKCERINSILRNFRGLCEIAGIRARQKKMIACMKTLEGEQISDRKGISDIFATFYEALYSKHPRTSGADRQGRRQEQVQMAALNLDELKTALRSLKNGRARDEAGITAEIKL